jgi:2-dehydro-3-deoxyphosphogluconate aldolase/(4S)-4-hydroxy-2-oxoglutarate aldolase
MDNKANIINVIRQQGLLPLYFNRDKEISGNILRSLYKSGIRVVEYTNRGPEALSNFRHLRNISDEELPGLLLGAGTIKTEDDAYAFVTENADFIISPGLNEKVGEVGYKKSVLWIPGCMTPSEIMMAEALDATLIKLFPGSLLGPGFLSSIKELFPELLFIPTGGVKLEEENLRAWFKSGVCAVGAGSTLISKEAIDAGNYASLESAAKKALEMVERVRSSLSAENSL